MKIFINPDTLPTIPEDTLTYFRETHLGLINYFLVLASLWITDEDRLMAEFDSAFVQLEEGPLYEEQAVYRKHINVLMAAYEQFYAMMNQTLPLKAWVKDDDDWDMTARIVDDKTWLFTLKRHVDST